MSSIKLREIIRKEIINQLFEKKKIDESIPKDKSKKVADIFNKMSGFSYYAGQNDASIVAPSTNNKKWFGQIVDILDKADIGKYSLNASQKPGYFILRFESIKEDGVKGMKWGEKNERSFEDVKADYQKADKKFDTSFNKLQNAKTKLQKLKNTGALNDRRGKFMPPLEYKRKLKELEDSVKVAQEEFKKISDEHSVKRGEYIDAQRAK